MKNTIKEKCTRGETITNAWLSIPDSWTAEIIANTGFDVVTIDAQHGLATDLTTILPMLQALSGSQSVPFVRLPENNPAFVMRMLDAGAIGLICPMINTAEDTENFVRSTKYHPQGNRSLGPIRSKLVYGKDYFKVANDLTMCFAMIETPEALRNLKEIAKVPNLDGLYVGPWDLSLSLGFEKLADFKDPEFLVILKEILIVCQENNLIPGIHATSPEDARISSELGFKFITIVNDSSALVNATKEALSKFNEC